MRITSGFRKLMPSIFGGAVGIALIIYGGNDDSPGLQFIGLAIFILSMVIMIRTRRRIACDIKVTNQARIPSEPTKHISES